MGIVNFVRTLHDLVLSILFTMRAMAWAMILLTIIIYIFAILFTQAATSSEHMEGRDERLQDLWGNLPTSMYTLYMSLTGAMDWGEVAAPLQTLGTGWLILFGIYITFCFFAFLNIVTSVFCQSAFEARETSVDTIIYNQLRCRQEYIKRIKKLFKYLNHSGTDLLSLDDFEKAFRDPCVQDGNGFVSQSEFVSGCMRLRGPAQRYDIVQLHAETLEMCENLAALHPQHFRRGDASPHPKPELLEEDPVGMRSATASPSTLRTADGIKDEVVLPGTVM
eukprot:NODE_385_length_1612_cov_119.231214.p3 GENE.NODE_385_length_1612_cov_119.231214~~NODE_385_length_1612_cov_119.231214.p3  ORF type:complete len:278 (-),score=100.00 NODE_385_length_1612_cov_119.231214:761-1594(-)